MKDFVFLMGVSLLAGVITPVVESVFTRMGSRVLGMTEKGVVTTAMNWKEKTAECVFNIDDKHMKRGGDER